MEVPRKEKSILRLHRPVDILREGSCPRDESFDGGAGDDNPNNFSLLVHYGSAGVSWRDRDCRLYEDSLSLQPREGADRAISVFRRRPEQVGCREANYGDGLHVI